LYEVGRGELDSESKSLIVLLWRVANTYFLYHYRMIPFIISVIYFKSF
jgi:hypothetical protein